MLINVMMIGGTNTRKGIFASFECAKLQGLLLNNILINDVPGTLMNRLDELATQS
jgi:hypothetical protein